MTRTRGKSTPASTAGSFTAHAHGVPDVALLDQPTPSEDRDHSPSAPLRPGTWSRLAFRDALAGHLGAEMLDPYDGAGPWAEPFENRVPTHVYRVMSDEDFRTSMLLGQHRSDERNNYIGQALADPEAWEGIDPEPEGTVAGRWAYLGYAANTATARLVRIEIEPDDGSEPHPDDDEGGYIRTFEPIHASRFTAWSPPFSARADDTYLVHPETVTERHCRR